MITPAGKRRTLIDIKQRDTGQDSMGQPVNTWTTYATVYARVVSESGRELYSAQQFNPEVTHLVCLQWSTDVQNLLPQMAVITPEGIWLDIIAVNFGERHLDDIVMTCKQRVGIATTA